MLSSRKLYRGTLVSCHMGAGILGAWMISACGEAPTEPLPELSAATSALVCEGDLEPPVLSLQSQDLFYECTGPEIGNLWEAPTLTATDACEGNVPVYRYNTGDDDLDGIPGTVDPDDFGPGPTTEIEGDTYVLYLARDSHENIGETILKVTVTDTLPPVLTLNGPDFLQSECFLPTQAGPQNPDPYVDPGASAVDHCYGDLSAAVVTSGEVNQQVPGIYALGYQVSDPAFAPNWAAPAWRVVEVIDTLPPVITQRPPLPLRPADGTLRHLSLNQCMELRDQCEGFLPPDGTCFITSIISDEPDADAGDILFEEGGSTFSLRAEASTGGNGRVYTVNFVCADSSGNPASGECTINVLAGP